MSALAPQGTVSGSGDQRRGYPGLPRAEGFPKGRAFPSLTAARDGQPSPAGGRRSALARTDPPKRFFSLGPCNRAAVGGSAALRWTAVRGFAALRMSRPPCGEMRHTPCGYGPFSFCQEQKENGGWNDPAIIMAGFPVQWDALGASPRGNGPGVRRC